MSSYSSAAQRTLKFMLQRWPDAVWMENVAVVAIEHRCLILFIELFHAYCASDSLLWCASLIHGLVDIMVRGSSEVSEGIIASFVVVVVVVLLYIFDKHLDSSHSKEEEYKE